jgi:hypothetical protein
VTTRLLHEAAKQAEARAAKESPGVFGWLANLFQPLVAHPAWAAVGALILIAGSAALLARRGAVSEKAEVPRPVEMAPATPAAETTTTVKEKAAEKAADSPAAAEGGPALDTGATKNDPDWRARATTEKQEKELDHVRGGKASGEFEAGLAEPAKKSKAKPAYDDLYGADDSGGARKPATVASPDAEKPKDELKRAESAPPAPPPAPVARPDNASDRRGYANEPTPQEAQSKAAGERNKLYEQEQRNNRELESAEGDEDNVQAVKPAAPRPADKVPPKPTSTPGRTGAGQSQAGPVGGTVGAASPQQQAPIQQAPAPSPPPEPSYAPRDSQQQQQAGEVAASQVQQTKGGSKEPTVQALHQQARQRVSRGRCGDALAITREISRRDESYYKRAVIGDRTAVCQETERSQTRKAPKPEPKRDSQEEAAPADLAK